MLSKDELNPFPEETTIVYGEITEEEQIDEKNISITIDLVNENMIKFDNEYVYQEIHNSQNINPNDFLFIYFASFNITIENYKQLFSNSIDGSYYKIELIPKNSLKKDLEDDKIPCTVFFAASPIITKEYYLKILEKKYSIPLKIPKFKNSTLSSKSSIKTELDKIFNYQIKVNFFRIHNVGQGNCSTILLKNNKKFFYDIGLTKYTKGDNKYNHFYNTVSMFNFNNYDVVILSHWDLDHYIGIITEPGGSILEKTWISPDSITGFNASRISYVIENFGKLIRIDSSINGQFYKKDDLVLFKGTGSEKNDSGIILGIDNGTNNLIAMGDVSYKHALAVSKFFNDINYLAVPHHGADIKSLFFNPKIPLSSTGYLKYPCDAIISVGYNTYKHLTNQAISDLHKAGFRILRTDIDGKQVIKF